jgi:tetratricopeptide (TPR) repeat protein
MSLCHCLFWVSLSFGFVSLAAPHKDPVAKQSSSGDLLRRAVRLMSEEKYQAAQSLLEEMLRASEEAIPPLAYYHLAVTYMKQGEWNKAEDALNKFLRISPQDLPSTYLKGYLLFRTGSYQESLALVSTYLERKPDSGEARKILALDHYMLGRPGEAEVELKRATELTPHDTEAYYYLGRIYFTKNNLPLALAAFKRAIEIDPRNVKAHNYLGQTYEGLAQYPAARAAYLKAIELEQKQATKSEWPYFNLGVLCIREGRAAEAIEYLRQALARNPSWSEGKVKLAMALCSVGQYEDALTHLNEGVRIDPQNAEARYQLAQLLTKMGRQEEARQHYLLFEKLKKP